MAFDPEVVAFRRAAPAVLIQAGRPVSLHELAAALAGDFGDRARRYGTWRAATVTTTYGGGGA
jgi:hypothetical protein